MCQGMGVSGGGCVLVWYAACSLAAEEACSDLLCHTRAWPPHPPSVHHGATVEW